MLQVALGQAYWRQTKSERRVMHNATVLLQRHLCKLTDWVLLTCRYKSQYPDAGAHLSVCITKLAQARRRLGYRYLWQFRRRGDHHANQKHVVYHLSGQVLNADVTSDLPLSGFCCCTRKRPAWRKNRVLTSFITGGRTTTNVGYRQR